MTFPDNESINKICKIDRSHQAKGSIDEGAFRLFSYVTGC